MPLDPVPLLVLPEPLVLALPSSLRQRSLSRPVSTLQRVAPAPVEEEPLVPTPAPDGDPVVLPEVLSLLPPVVAPVLLPMPLAPVPPPAPPDVWAIEAADMANNAAAVAVTIRFN